MSPFDNYNRICAEHATVYSGYEYDEIILWVMDDASSAVRELSSLLVEGECYRRSEREIEKLDEQIKALEPMLPHRFTKKHKYTAEHRAAIRKTEKLMARSREVSRRSTRPDSPEDTLRAQRSIVFGIGVETFGLRGDSYQANKTGLRIVVNTAIKRERERHLKDAVERAAVRIATAPLIRALDRNGEYALRETFRDLGLETPPRARR